MSATGAFATIILERLLDILTVLVLLAAFVFVFGRDLAAANRWLRGREVGGGDRRARSLVALVVLFVLAGNPAKLARR